MKTWRNVARYHLANRSDFLVVPWAWLAFAFVVDLIIFALIPVSQHTIETAAGPVQVADPSGRFAGGLAAIVIIFFVLGVQSVARSLPFALTLGVSRRSYYIGTALLAVSLGAVYSLVITALQAIERATNGWGLQTNVFRVPYILDGPWYLTWFTSFVVLTFLFAYGMWFGIAYRRWNLIGTLSLGACQVVVVVLAVASITWSHAWPSTGHFFTTLSAAGLTGLLVALSAVLMAGGYATVRHATVLSPAPPGATRYRTIRTLSRTVHD